MRRLLHNALCAWFLITITMAQGCIAPAQSGRAYTSRDSFSPGASARSGPANQSISANQNAAPLDTHGYVADQSASNALTDHFKHHRLPLVGAQVLRNPANGARAVVLYGFVGSDFGKSDAQRQAEDFINDPSVDVDNRIRVNPDLLAAGRSSTAPPATGSSNAPDAQANTSMPGVQSYVDQQNQSAQVQQYQQQNALTGMSTMLPLIALMGILGMGIAGGSSSFSTGPSMGYSPYGYSSPFGYSPYAPYSGYPSPAPPLSTFGSPGYGSGSPGSGVTPFGSLPGSPYYSSP
jgi:hypothetical protein